MAWTTLSLFDFDFCSHSTLINNDLTPLPSLFFIIPGRPAMLSAPSALAGLALAASQLVSASPIAGGPILSTRDLLHLQRRAELNTTDFVLEHHLGNLSPYWTPPSNYSLELPAECKVDQVSLMQRHGSRYPLASENVYSTNVSTLFQSEEGQRLLANVTGDLAFLKSESLARLCLPFLSSALSVHDVDKKTSNSADGFAAWVNKLGHDDLTAPGRQQLFEHGVAVNLSYPHLYTDVLTVGNQDRVYVLPFSLSDTPGLIYNPPSSFSVESAQWFQAGYYGRHAVNVSTINLIEEDDVTFSPITPMDNCKPSSVLSELIPVSYLIFLNLQARLGSTQWEPELLRRGTQFTSLQSLSDSMRSCPASTSPRTTSTACCTLLLMGSQTLGSSFPLAASRSLLQCTDGSDSPIFADRLPSPTSSFPRRSLTSSTSLTFS